MDKNTNYSVLGSMESFASRKYLDMEQANRKSALIAMIAMTVLLMVASEVGYALKLPEIINVAIGAPSGVILFFILFLELETLRGKLTEYKLKFTPRVRNSKLIKYWSVLIPLLIISSTLPIQPLGGAIIIAAFMLSASFARKTEDENYYATNGLIDPRETVEESEDKE